MLYKFHMFGEALAFLKTSIGRVNTIIGHVC